MAARAKSARKTRFAKPGKKAGGTTTSMSLTPDTVAILERLESELGDRLGRSISTSAILRALLRHVGQQSDIAGILDALIVKELAAGVRWGKASAKRKRKVINLRST